MKRWTPNETYRFLEHARAHCLYGPKTVDRTPEQADRDAAAIMRQAQVLLHQCIVRLRDRGLGA